MNKRIVYGIVIVLAVVVVGALGWGKYGMRQKVTPRPSPTATVRQSSNGAAAQQSTGSAVSAHTLSYKGEDGKTALELLKQHDPTAQTKGEGTNAYVTSIGGYTADDVKHEYWEMMVNGKSSTVGAGSYTTKSTDTIEWKIATY